MTAAKVTISDVARAAGVAQSTVSLVLNNRDRVSQDTRQRVERIMDELGYVPRRNVARSRRHVAILHGRGMIFCKELVRYCREWIAGIREGMGDDRADLSVFRGGEHVSTDFLFEAGLGDDGLDGVIVMGVYPRDGYLQRVLETGLPVVAMERMPEHAEFSSVCLDHRMASQLVADHLVELGHRRIALCMRSDAYQHRALHAAFQERLREHGLELALYLHDANISFDDLPAFDRRARHLLDEGVTAVFTGDPGAYRLANAFHAMGVDVPGRVSLVGFDNLGLRTDVGRRLCSIDYDEREMGRRAGRMLQDLLSAQGSVSNLTAIMPPQLYPGQTTGPCAVG